MTSSAGITVLLVLRFGWRSTHRDLEVGAYWVGVENVGSVSWLGEAIVKVQSWGG